MFLKNYLKFFKLYETYKSIEIFGKFSYLVEKFTVAAKGIFSGGTLGPLKDYQAATAGGPVAKALWTVAKFHFLNRFKVFENEFIFQKCQHFSSPKDAFF